MLRTCSVLLLFLSALAVSAGAPDRIPAGYDAWITVGGGATFMSFDEEPIPADFFCEGSLAFDSRIHFEGVPLATDPPSRLGISDTIVERLDDAYFTDGSAISRVRVKAIHLASREEIVNGCGVWTVQVGLTEEQPTTTIEYNKFDDFSGTFNAELVLNVKMTFTNTENPEDVRVLKRTVHFTEFTESPYTLLKAADLGTGEPTRSPGKRTIDSGLNLKIDTDADGIPDSVMRQTAKDDWHYINGYVCPIGVTPPDSRCELWRQVHEVPTHAHITLPGAPPNPCASVTPVFSNQIDRLDISSSEVTPVLTEIGPIQAYPCPSVIATPTINNLRGAIEELESEGRLIISTDELVGELLRKAEQ